MQATTAVVTPVECRADVHKTAPGMAFQGILTEKYLRYEQEKPMATNTLTYVLVTPKAVELTRGGLVEVAGEPHVVQVAHTLDPAKNEYELCLLYTSGSLWTIWRGGSSGTECPMGTGYGRNF